MEPPPPPEKIKALLPKLADLPKTAEEKAKTEAELRSEVRSLKAQLRSVPVQKVQPSAAKVVDTRAIERAVANTEKHYRLLFARQAKSFRTIGEYLERSSMIAKTEAEMAQREASRQGPEISGGEIQSKGGNLPVRAPAQPALAAKQIYPPTHPRPDIHANGDGGALGGPHRKILQALAELRSIDKHQPPKEMVAAWAGYSPNGGAFTNPLGALRTQGLVSYPSGGAVALTDAGLAEVGELPAPDQEEVHRRILNILSGPERKILAALIEHRDETVTKTQLAEESGYSEGGGAFTNPLGALRTKAFVEYPAPGQVKCADWLFME